MPNLGCYTLLTRDISFNLEAFIYYSNLPLHSPLSDILQIQKWRCLGLGSIENVTTTRDVSRNGPDWKNHALIFCDLFRFWDSISSQFEIIQQSTNCTTLLKQDK